MTTSHWSDALLADLPSDADQWLRTQPDYATAWSGCERGDWLLLLASASHIDVPTLVRASCACARLWLPMLPDGDMRPRRALAKAEAWASGRATLSEVREAASEAFDCHDAARDESDSMYYATAAAWAAANTAEEPSCAWASAVNHVDKRRCAEVVRGIIPDAPALLASWSEAPATPEQVTP